MGIDNWRCNGLFGEMMGIDGWHGVVIEFSSFFMEKDDQFGLTSPFLRKNCMIPGGARFIAVAIHQDFRISFKERFIKVFVISSSAFINLNLSKCLDVLQCFGLPRCFSL